MLEKMARGALTCATLCGTAWAHPGHAAAAAHSHVGEWLMGSGAAAAAALALAWWWRKGRR